MLTREAILWGLVGGSLTIFFEINAKRNAPPPSEPDPSAEKWKWFDWLSPIVRIAMGGLVVYIFFKNTDTIIGEIYLGGSAPAILRSILSGVQNPPTKTDQNPKRTVPDEDE